MKIRRLGGSQVGASCDEIIFRDGEGGLRRILHDAGVVPRTRKPHLPPSGAVDIVVASHAHDDHVANIPMTFFENPEAGLICSTATAHLAKINWLSTLNILSRETRESHERADFLNRFAVGLEYAARNLKMIEKAGEWMEIFPGVFMYNRSSGHLPGAMWTMLKVAGEVVVFSGDMTFQDRPTVGGTVLSEFPREEIDALFLDSTNGAKDTPQLEGEEKRMLDDVRHDMAERRTSLFAALTLGRLPDLATFFAENGIDSYVDGQGVESIDETLSRHGRWDHGVEKVFEEENRSFFNGDFRSYNFGRARIRLVENDYQRRRLIDMPGPKVIVAPSGMLTGGRSVQYMSILLRDPEARVNLTSYQAEETPGRELKRKILTGGTLMLEDAKGRKFKVPIKALVRDYNLSSHAGASELIEMVKYLNPKRTLLVHGETRGRENLKVRLAENGYYNAFVPHDGDEIEI